MTVSNADAPLIVIPIVAGIGNALLATPMIRALKRQMPDARIVVLARIEAMAEVFRRLPEVDSVVVTGPGIGGLLRLLRESRSRHPDVFLVPFPSNRWQYSLLAAASGARRHVLHDYPVGYWRAMRFLPADRVPAARGTHDAIQNLSLLRAIGIDVDDADARPVFAVNQADREAAEELLRKAAVDVGAKPIVIHAGSAKTILAQAKRWPAKSYAKLVDAIRSERSEPIVLIEGPDEEGVAAEILQLCERDGRGGAPIMIVRLAGPLGEAAAVLERASLYVGSDSGLAHLAGAVGTRAVTLFAPADPDRVCPYGQRDLVVQTPNACAPCMQYPWKSPHPKILCKDPMCIGAITIEQVMQKVRDAQAAPSPSLPVLTPLPSHPLTLSSSAPSRRAASFWLRSIAWIICAIVLAFVCIALVKELRAVKWSAVHPRAVPALAAIACAFGVSVMQLAARWTLLIAYDHHLGWRIQLPAAWVPQIGKYVPGGVASVGGTVYILRRHGVPAAIGLSVAVLLDALAVMAGLIVSAPLLLTGPIRARYPMAWIACVVMTLIGLLLLHPRVFVAMLNLALKTIGRQTIDRAPPVRRYLWPVLASFGQWILAGFSLWFMTMAVTNVSVKLIPLFIASAALAMTVSYLMPFAPGGIGIREGLYLVTLGPVVGPVTAVVVVAMRVIQTVLEVVLAIIGAGMLRKNPSMTLAGGLESTDQLTIENVSGPSGTA